MLTKRLKLFGEMVTITPIWVIVILVVILRIPTLFEPYWYGDEGIYLTLGQAVRQGLVLYKDIFDHKPPLLYWFAALAGNVFWFRFILLIWSAGTVILFWKLAGKLFETNEKATLLSTALLALLTTIPMFEGNIANAEVFMIGTTIGAFYLLFSGITLTTKRLIYAGMLLSLSFLFKVPSIFDAGALVFYWFAREFNFKRIISTFRRSLILGIGFLAPVLFTLIYYWSRGALADYLNTAGVFNSAYIANWSTPTASASSALLSGGFQTRVLVFLVLLLLIVLWRKRLGRVGIFVTSWLVFSSFAMLLSGRPYPHYALQAMPALVLVIAILAFGRERTRFLVVPFIGVFLFSLVFYKFYTYPTFSYYQNFLSFATGHKDTKGYRSYFGPEVERTYKLAKFLSTRTTKKDRVFIWGTVPSLYALSRRVPPVKYTTSFHIRDLGAEGETLAKLDLGRPKYIIKVLDTKEELPGLDAFLAKNYIFCQEIDNAQIWRRLNAKKQ